MEILEPAERIKRYGIDCRGPSGDGIFFKAGRWRPGGEYIQKLIIKNVSTQVKKLKYRLPSTRYFSLPYPEPIVLSPGIFKEIDVIFRPVEHDPYDDTIYIKMLDGLEDSGFHVPVKATIDKLILTAIDSINMNYCPTHQVSSVSFTMRNAGEVDSPFSWDVPEPFIFIPATGVIPVNGSQEIVVEIRPMDAAVFTSQAVCAVGTGVHAIIPEPILVTNLRAIAKYTFISLSQPVVSFEEVVSGTTPTPKEILLCNDTVVPAEFHLVRFDGDRDEVFNIFPKSGVIQPHTTIPVKIHFNALAMGCYSLDRYAFRTPSNCSAVLTCKGLTLPPNVVLAKEALATNPNTTKKQLEGSQTSIPLDENSMTLTSTMMVDEGAPEFSLNFRDVEVGRVETRILYIRNNSNRDAAFSVITDSNGVFSVHPRQGVIPALWQRYSIQIQFSPSCPINYYRRFFVLIGDALPRFYDCLGTGFIRARGEVKEQRPAPIRHAHVQAFRNRSLLGMGVLNADELDYLYEKGEVPDQYFAKTGRTGTRALSVTMFQNPITRTGEAVRNEVAPAHEFFINPSDANFKEVVVNRHVLDFNYTPYMKSSAPKLVTIHNQTNAKVLVQWHVPVVKRDIKEAKKETAQKALSPIRSKDREIITRDSAEKALQQLQAFRVFPVNADINPGKSVTFEVFFEPKQSNRNFLSELEAYVFFKNQRTFRLVHDHSLTPPWCVNVSVTGHTFSSGQLLAKAGVCGGNIKGGKLLFPCAFQNESIYQTFMVRNTSNLPATFRIEMGWQGSEEFETKDDGIFTAKPTMGEIEAEDFVLICVRFNPRETRKYTQLLRIFVNGDEGGKLLLEGSGAVPFVVLPDLLPESLTTPELVWGVPRRFPKSIPRGPQGVFYLKPTCVGLSSQRKLCVKNATRLPLRFRIEWNAAALNSGVVAISPMKGVLRGNEDTQLTISFAPRKVTEYNFRLQIYVYPIGGKTKPVRDANQPGPEETPELLQSLSVQILARSEVSALIFDPVNVTADVRLVDTSENRDIYVENVSDSDLSFELLYKELFSPDYGGIRAAKTESDVMRLVAKDEIGNAEGKKKALNGFDHSLFCESPSGVLPARSRQRIVFTYRPRKSGLFEFVIFAQVRAVDGSNGQTLVISNDEAALLRVSQKDRVDQIEDQMVNELANLPLVSHFTARAAFPKLLFEDIRVESDIQISDVEYLWRRFTFAPLNYDLSIPLTTEEVKFNNSSSPDYSQLTVYPFEFSPGVVQSPKQCITIQLRNSGYLTTEFDMHFPNEKQLDLEAWCDEEEPSEELNRLICIIEELKLFKIEPTRGVLQPGEICNISISYSHNSLKYGGFHNLPVLVRIAQGKQFYLNFIGQTLPPPVLLMLQMNKRRSVEAMPSTSHSLPSGPPPSGGSGLGKSGADVAQALVGGIPLSAAVAISDIMLVVCSEKGGVVRFLPVPTGLTADLAPLQRVEVINVSASDILYEVEAPDMQRLNDENFHMPIVRVANPSGTITACSSIFLEFYFYPLETKTYEFQFSIKYTSAGLVAHSNSMISLDPVPLTSRTSGSRRGMTSGQSVKSGRTRDSQSNYASSYFQIEPPAPSFQFLDLTVHATGYDPRDERPVLRESLYEGGLPSQKPLLKLPNQKVTLSHDMLDFQIIPQLCVARRMVTLRNDSSTSAFEFTVEDMSCFLCVDGILAVKPAFGRVPPNSGIVLEFVFSAYLQPLAFEEKVKITIREVLKSVSAKKTGGRQALLDRLKNMKSKEISHESVVARATAARTGKIENFMTPGGKLGSYPNTISKDGELVTADRTTSNQNSQDTFNFAASSAEISTFEAPGVDSSTRFRSASLGLMDPSVVGSIQQSRTMPESSIAPSRASSRHPRNASSGQMSTRGMSRGISGASGMTGVGSVLSGVDTARSVLGATSCLIVRVKGETYPIGTVKEVLERGGARDVMSEYVEPPCMEKGKGTDPTKGIPAFIPPVGRKFFEEQFLEEQKKLHSRSRVNLEFVKHRDEELRGVATLVMEKMCSEILSTDSVKRHLVTTITNVNQQSIKISAVDRSKKIVPIEAEPKLLEEPAYGVYFNEVLPRRPLLERVMLEMKYLGFRSYHPPLIPIYTEAPNAVWKTKEEEVLLLDKLTYSLTMRQLWNVLATVGFDDPPTSRIYRQFDAASRKVAHRVADSNTLDSISGSVSLAGENTAELDGELDPDIHTVGIREWVLALPPSAQSRLECIVNKRQSQRDRLRKEAKKDLNVIKIHDDSDEALLVNVEEEEEEEKRMDLSEADHALRNQGFLEIAQKVLAETFLSLMQDTVNEIGNDVELSQP